MPGLIIESILGTDVAPLKDHLGFPAAPLRASGRDGKAVFFHQPGKHGHAAASQFQRTLG